MYKNSPAPPHQSRPDLPSATFGRYAPAQIAHRALLQVTSPASAATRLRVALLPELIEPDPVGVCAVVDVIRASTTLVELAGSGDPAVWLAADHAAARAAAPRLGSGVLLGGEEGGLRPEGYDFGNSPREVADGAYAGRRAIFVTTNGTHALRRWSMARRTFVGALRNRDAVARRLVEEAAGGSMTLVCAGKEGTLALDDVYTAGVIVARILELRPDLELDETAIAALRVAQAQPNAEAALAESQSAQALVGVGLWDDVPYCAVLDASSAVPELGGAGRLRLLEDG